MDAHAPSPTPPVVPPAPARPSWSQRYGERHRLARVTAFPAGVAAPQTVRLYRRREHFVLQWWDPGAKRTRSDRVDGDLVAAIARARQVEERLANFRSAGPARRRRLDHDELVERFLDDLGKRADAGAVAPATVRRYAAALSHYRAFAVTPSAIRAAPHAAAAGRDFRLAFAAFLAGRAVAPNGHARAARRPMRGQAFVLDAVRALYEWAADPDRGGLVPDGFRNPFRRPAGARPVFRGDPLSEPAVTAAMAADFLAACDRHQLLLFAPLVLFGLRAAEPCLLFREDVDADWLRVPCRPELDYRTKGQRDKRFPLVDDLRPLGDALRSGRPGGLLYQRRAVAEGREHAPLAGAARAELVAEYRRRCAAAGPGGAAARLRLRDAVRRDAGGLGYGHVRRELDRVARRLGWPAAATPKAFRHLFATALANGGLPEGYRRYLLGHAPGRAAAVAYTHLNQLGRQYAEAVRRELAPVVDAVRRRLAELG
jgi:integrase